MVSALVLAALIALQQPAPGPAPRLAPALPVTRPAWVERLPEVPGRLYALGTADLVAQEGQSIARASVRARLEVVGRLRSTVKGQTSIATRTRETQLDGRTGERVVRDEVSIGVKAEELPGLVVEQTFTDAGARTVYALAYLDLVQARASLGSRLDGITQARTRLGAEASRKALWKVRKLSQDLDRLEEALALLASAGIGLDLRPAFQAERAAVDLRLAQLKQADLPPVDFAHIAVAVRANVELPAGVEAWLRTQLTTCGLLSRDLEPELILDLAFAEGSKGPEFIHADLDFYSGVTYRLEAKLSLTEGGGAPLTRPVPILIVQGDSPEGMVNQFRRQIERWLPRLLEAFKAELQ